MPQFEHIVEVLALPQIDQQAGAIIEGAPPVYQAFCSCDWISDCWVDIDNCIYGQTVDHLKDVGKYEPGHCGTEGLGCPILQIDGDDVNELECDLCGSTWNWNPRQGWTRTVEV